MCKITSLPNPHIYWVVIFVQLYIITLGLIILILGSLNTSQYTKLEGKLISESMINIVAIFLAVAVIGTGIAGIILVICWKWKYLAVHSAVTLSVAILLFVFGIYWLATFDRDTFIGDLNDRLITSFGDQTGNAQEVNATQFSSIQKNFQCCGLNSWKDYRQNFQKEFTIPASCCRNCEDGDKLHFTRDRDVGDGQLYDQGCLMKLLAFTSMTYTEMRMYFLCSLLPMTQSGILLAILAHFIRYRYI